jgi:phage-related protein
MASELATGYVTLIPSAKGFRNALDNEIGGGMDAAGGAAGDKAAHGFGTRFASGIKTAAKVAAVGLAAAFVGALALGKASIDAASDLSESQSKVNVVFGDSADAVTKFAQGAAKGLGQSTQQALEATGTFGNLMQAFGIARGPAADMSTALVTLATDLASFNNTSVDEALQALQSGLSGEVEPMRKYGASLSDVRLKQEAVALGLIKTTKDALDPAAKAQAAYSLIMKDTALAQGDFARTSGGLANQQRILNAQFENAKASIGQALLPAMTAVVSFVADKLPGAIDALKGFASAIGEGFSAKSVNADGVIGVFQQIGVVAREVVDWFQRNWHTIQDVTVAVLTAVGVAAKFLIEEVFPRIVTAGQAVTNFFADHWPEIESVFNTVYDSVRAVVDWFVKNWPAIQEGFSTTFEGFKSAWELIGVPVYDAVKGVVQWFKDNWPTIKDALTTTFDKLKEAWDTVGKPAMDDVKGIVAWFEENWPKIQATFEVSMAAIKGAWDAVGAPVFESIKQAAQGVSDAFSTSWPVISTIVSTAFGTIQTVVGTAMEVIKTIVGAVLTDISALWDTFGGSIKDQTTTTWDFIKTTVENNLGLIRGIIDTVSALIHGDWSGFWDGMKTIVTTSWGLIGGAVKFGGDTVKNIMSATWEGVKNTTSSAWDTVKTTVSNAVGNVVETIRGLPAKAGSALSTLGTSIGEKIGEAAKTAVSAAATLVSNVIEEIKKLPGKAVSALGNAAGSIASSVIGAIKNGINAAIDQINSHRPSVSAFGITLTVPPLPHIFHEGGLVPGRPGADVPAILQAGELVIPRDQVENGKFAGSGITIGTLVAADADDTIRKLELLSWRQRMAVA